MRGHTKLFLFTILDMCRSDMYRSIYSVNPLHLVFRKVNGYFEKINKNKYLTLVPSNESKEIKKI